MRVEFFGEADPSVVRTFALQLAEQCGRLGIAVAFGSVARNSGEPRILVIFVNRDIRWPDRMDRWLRSLLADGVMILPVVPNPPAARYLPSSVSHLNAFVMSIFVRNRKVMRAQDSSVERCPETKRLQCAVP